MICYGVSVDTLTCLGQRHIPRRLPVLRPPGTLLSAEKRFDQITLGTPGRQFVQQNATMEFDRSLFGSLVVAIGFVFLLETGELVEWLSRNRETKIDEVIVVAVLFLLGVCVLFVRRWLGLSIQVATSSEPETVSFVARARRGLRRDLLGIGIALFAAVVLVFLFDTDWLVEWLAQHKSAKIDEIIVVSIVLLIGLSFFSVRRSIELTDHLQRYQELHEKTAKLNRQAALMPELGDMLQSCISLPEAYPIITSRAQVLLPRSAGAVCTISSSRNMVEVVGTWEHPSLSESFFTLEECWALRRGRIHVSGKANEALSCAQPRPSRALCVPMMAHGETLGLLMWTPGGIEPRPPMEYKLEIWTSKWPRRSPNKQRWLWPI